MSKYLIEPSELIELLSKPEEELLHLRVLDATK